MKGQWLRLPRDSLSIDLFSHSNNSSPFCEQATRAPSIFDGDPSKQDQRHLPQTLRRSLGPPALPVAVKMSLSDRTSYYSSSGNVADAELVHGTFKQLESPPLSRRNSVDLTDNEKDEYNFNNA